MAFPDLGAVDVYRAFTVNGLEYGHAMYKMLAGVSKNQDMHYMALTFALIGGISILLMPKFHNFKTIGPWLLLVFISIIFPYSDKLFLYPVSIDGNTTTSATDNIDITTDFKDGKNDAVDKDGYLAFTPQVAIIDITSRLHRIIYSAFHENGKLIDIKAAAHSSQAFATLPNMHLAGRPDLQANVIAYQKLGCGNYEDLTLTPRPTPKSTGSSTGTLPALLAPEGLQNKTFRMGQIANLIKVHQIAFKGDSGHSFPPFAATYSSAAMFDEIAKENDMDIGVRKQLKADFILATTDPTHTVAQLQTTLNYLYIDADKMGYFLRAKQGEKEWRGHVKGGLNSYGFDDITGGNTKLTKIDIGLFSNGAIDVAEARFNATRHDFPNQKESFYLYGPKDIDFDSKDNKVKENNLVSLPVILGLLESNRPSGSIVNGTYSYNKMFDLSTSSIEKSTLAPKVQEAIELHNFNPKYKVNTFTNCWQLHKHLHQRLLAHFTRNNFLAKANMPTSTVTNKTLYPNTNTYDTDEGGDIQNIINQGKFTSYIAKLITTHDNFIKASKTQYEQATANLNSGQTALATYYKQLSSSIDKNQTYKAYKGTKSPQKDTYLHREIVRSIIATGLAKTNAFKSRALVDDKQYESTRGINDQMSDDHLLDKLSTPGKIIGTISKWVGSIAINIGSWFEGGKILAYMEFLRLMVSLALFAILFITPLLFIIGILVPSYAMGVLTISVGAVLILKTIPIGFTLTDIIISAVFQMMESSSYSHVFDYNIDSALMIYAMSTAYTSIVGITMFLLFKSGDASSLGAIQGIDGAANKIADTAQSLAIAGAGVAAAVATAGVGGAIGGAAKAASLGKSKFKGAVMGGIGQGIEPITHSASNIPILSNIIAEGNPVRAIREGSGQVKAIEGVGGIGNYWKTSNKAKQIDANAKYQSTIDKADSVPNFNEDKVFEGSEITLEQSERAEARRDDSKRRMQTTAKNSQMGDIMVDFVYRDENGVRQEEDGGLSHLRSKMTTHLVNDKHMSLDKADQKVEKLMRQMFAESRNSKKEGGQALISAKSHTNKDGTVSFGYNVNSNLKGVAENGAATSEVKKFIEENLKDNTTTRDGKQFIESGNHQVYRGSTSNGGSSGGKASSIVARAKAKGSRKS